VAVSAAISGFTAMPSMAADGQLEEVVVSGIRTSLTKSMDIKRESTGVVDAISAEDMGKFPDTNLAESLQRISGVSIDRVNGEGSAVTVRGFGPGYNLVTLNGRQLPAAHVNTISGNSNTSGAEGSSRSFDFSNLASEGVSALEVHKTGNATVASGGIGATINVVTNKPLESKNQATFGVKAVSDRDGDANKITPEASGLWSWSNDDNRFGISVFGSYQEREFTGRSVSVSQYQIQPFSPSLSYLSNATVTNPPTTGALSTIPFNVGLEYDQSKRQRANGMVTLQFAPDEHTMITADAMYTQTKMANTALVPGIWYSRQYTHVGYDGNPIVASASSIEEYIAPANGRGKDYFHASWQMATKDQSETYGLNVKRGFMDDTLTLAFDAAHSKSESGGDGPMGKNVWRTNLAAAGAGWQAMQIHNGIPDVSIGVTQNLGQGGTDNGVLDIGDLGTQALLTTDSRQTTTVDQFKLAGKWNKVEGVTVDFGVGMQSTKMHQAHKDTLDFLGGWGVGVYDVPAAAKPMIKQINILTKFNDLKFTGYPNASALAAAASASHGGTGSYYVTQLGKETFLIPNVYNYAKAISGTQFGGGSPVPFNVNNLTTSSFNDNTIKEEITSGYISAKFDGEISGMKTQTVAGLRYESTSVTAGALQNAPQSVTWLSDNDFRQNFGTTLASVGAKSNYNNWLPNLDFSVAVTDTIKARASISQTIGRTAYNNMYMTTSVGNPPTPSLLGGQATGSRGNPALLPLESTNIDLSVEWYYAKGSYASVGLFRKSVNNFVGTGSTHTNLFGLRDVSKGPLAQAAAAALTQRGFAVNEQNLFTMAAILSDPTHFPTGSAAYIDPTQPGGSDLAFAMISAYDLQPSAADPLTDFQVTTPVNTHTSNVEGAEFAWQHFFGDTGFGFQANATLVSGDVGYNLAGAPGVDQFALEGLANSANLVGIYENHGFSVRVAYNWRDKFLASTVSPGLQVGSPTFIDEHKQIDFNVSYNINDQLSVSLDGINITGEGIRSTSRTNNMLHFAAEGDPRFMLGARYKFK
jgi:TonB-dependent receptor